MRGMVLRLRSGFRLRTPASLTPAQRLKFESRLAHHARDGPSTALRISPADSRFAHARTAAQVRVPPRPPCAARKARIRRKYSDCIMIGWKSNSPVHRGEWRSVKWHFLEERTTLQKRLRPKVSGEPLDGPVAQRLEQGTHNPLVGGSNPSGPTSLRPLWRASARHASPLLARRANRPALQSGYAKARFRFSMASSISWRFLKPTVTASTPALRKAKRIASTRSLCCVKAPLPISFILMTPMPSFLTC